MSPLSPIAHWRLEDANRIIGNVCFLDPGGFGERPRPGSLLAWGHPLRRSPAHAAGRHRWLARRSQRPRGQSAGSVDRGPRWPHRPWWIRPQLRLRGVDQPRSGCHPGNRFRASSAGAAAPTSGFLPNGAFCADDRRTDGDALPSTRRAPTLSCLDLVDSVDHAGPHTSCRWTKGRVVARCQPISSPFPLRRGGQPDGRHRGDGLWPVVLNPLWAGNAVGWIRPGATRDPRVRTGTRTGGGLMDPAHFVLSSGRLLFEKVERSRSEKWRTEDVVVGYARQDRKRVPALRPAFAHPAAVPQAAIEQFEHLDVVARRRHVGIGSDDERRHLETADLLREVIVLRHRFAHLVQ